MNQKIGAGLIGTAHAHAVGHLKALRASESFELIAVAEPNEELLTKAKKDPRWSEVNWVNVDGLLSDERVRMVCVETDPLESLPFARRAVKAGKHVKIDKPPGADLKALEAVFKEAEMRHCVVQMGYVYRYNPAFRLAHRAIKEKWLGPIRSAVCQIDDKKLDTVYRRGLERYPGGQMFELCGHMIDALVWLLGKPVRTSSVLRQSEPDKDKFQDDVLAAIEFDSAVGVVKSQVRQSERYFHLFGDEGTILIDSPDQPQVRLSLSTPRGPYQAGTHKIAVGPAVRYVPDLEDLAGAIRDNRWVEYFTAEHDLAVQRTLLTACGVKV